MKPAEQQQLPAELAQLEQLASAADADLVGASEISAPGAEPAAPEPSTADQIKGLLHLAVMTLAPALPFLPDCYPEATREQIAVCAAEVCKKHGWDVGSVMTPELALAAVSIPPTIAAVMVGRQYFAAKRAAEASSSSTSPALAIDARPQAGERILPA